ncbi:hypothetical protein NLI96_g4123 [Meripilus lineatus]|uniref:Uncharacterized protein n=1 Tax=Meripilus lineatus TaxID=2056292 RepID=A0AAD5V5R5_9APHY|nr:hypothetical protein NLI96_g4123 [Physisporinus lineatus]
MKVKSLDIFMEYCEKQFHEVQVWSDVADRLRGLPPESRDPEIQSQAVEALTGVIHTIDMTLELPEIDDWLINNLIHPMLLLQSKALLSRYRLLDNRDDFDRALQIYEIASQLSVRNSPLPDIVHDYNALRTSKVSRNISENPIYIDAAQAKRRWISHVPSSRFQKSLAVNILIEFCNKQLHEVKVWSDVADRLRGLPPEFRDPEIQSQAVEALTGVIHTIDITLELPEIDDWLINYFIYPMLRLQAKALISRHHLLGSWNDYDRALQIYEIASQLSVLNTPSLDIVHNYNILRASKFCENASEGIDAVLAKQRWISHVPSFRLVLLYCLGVLPSD